MILNLEIRLPAFNGHLLSCGLIYQNDRRFPIFEAQESINFLKECIFIREAFVGQYHKIFANSAQKLNQTRKDKRTHKHTGIERNV